MQQDQLLSSILQHHKNPISRRQSLMHNRRRSLGMIGFLPKIVVDSSFTSWNQVSLPLSAVSNKREAEYLCYCQAVLATESMKGYKKRETTYFKAGHIPHNKGLRYTDDTLPISSAASVPMTRSMRVDKFSHRSVIEPTKGGLQSIQQPHCSATQEYAKQKLDLKETTLSEQDGTRMICMKKNIEMWNDIIYRHRKQIKKCYRPEFQIAQERQWGLVWKHTMMCKNCSFMSPEYKLYEEIKTKKPGPNPAALNWMFQAGLQDTPMGNTRARYLLAATDIPPPSKTSMKRASNTVGKATIELNQKDMTNKLKLVKEVNVRRGVMHPEQVNVAFDARYNSITFGHEKKPGQSSSQAVGIACETDTEMQYIVGAAVENKLCWTGAWMKGNGFNVTCPGGHVDCTANLSPVAPHSEYEMARDIGNKFMVQEVLIRHATTDGDAQSAAGFQAAYRILHPMWKVERMSDPIHLGRLQFKRCNAAVFSDNIFPGARTRQAKKLKQKVLSQDIKARCGLIFKQLMQENSGDVNKLKCQLPHVLDATLRCYSGDCSKCRRYSKVCGGGSNNSWWMRSAYLGPHQMTHLNMTENDKKILLEVLKMKLSCDVVQRLRLNTNTQKCESVNRSISVSLPKNVNYSRNFEARVHSTIHRLNNRLGASLNTKVTHLGGTLSPRTLRALEKMDKTITYHQMYQKHAKTKKRILARRGQMIRAHRKYRDQQGGNRKSDYCQGQLDTKGDHTYAQD